MKYADTNIKYRNNLSIKYCTNIKNCHLEIAAKGLCVG